MLFIKLLKQAALFLEILVLIYTPGTQRKDIKEFLYCENLGIKTIVADLAGEKSGGQSIVDEEKTAGYVQVENKIYIMDHNFQGFNVLKYAKPGITLFLYINGKTSQYLCIRTAHGHHNGTLRTFTNDDGTYVHLCRGDLILYTCDDSGNKHNVIITYWEATR